MRTDGHGGSASIVIPDYWWYVARADLLEAALRPHVEGAEKAFLAGRRSREADLESAVRIFLEFLRAFEAALAAQRTASVIVASSVSTWDHRLRMWA